MRWHLLRLNHGLFCILTEKFFDLKQQSRFSSKIFQTFFRIFRDSAGVSPAARRDSSADRRLPRRGWNGKRSLPLLAWLSGQMLLSLVRELANLLVRFRTKLNRIMRSKARKTISPSKHLATRSDVPVRQNLKELPSPFAFSDNTRRHCDRVPGA